MLNSDHTLSSPAWTASGSERRLLGLTIAWHPDMARIGEQCIVSDAALALSRYLPLFRAPGEAGTGLGHGGVSRAALQVERGADDGLTITPPASRMAVEINGRLIDGPAHLTAQQVEAGVVLGLGRAVLLCLHWMHCLPQTDALEGLLGVGSASIRLRSLIRHVAPTDATVLLLGETGTGKEVVARALHALSRRAGAPLVSVNMAALNESLAAADLFGTSRGAFTGAHSARDGLFTEAQGATLFLDEVGNTPATVQPMLLRVLETGDYRPLGGQRDLHSTARLIAATDQDLYGGAFNMALLRRLESCIIHLPPLRARREDIGVLMAHLLHAAPQEWPIGLVQRFLAYDWPGNIRQLAHVLKRAELALRMGETPQFDALVDARIEGGSVLAAVPAIPAPQPRKLLADYSEAEVLAAMQANGWSIQGAAHTLGVSRPTLYKLLESHSQIRQLAQIAPDAIAAAWSSCGGDLEDCAAHVRTPAGALRRHLRGLGMLA